MRGAEEKMLFWSYGFCRFYEQTMNENRINQYINHIKTFYHEIAASLSSVELMGKSSNWKIFSFYTDVLMTFK